jgi:hypothetical protein
VVADGQQDLDVVTILLSAMAVGGQSDPHVGGELGEGLAQGLSGNDD